MFYENLIFDTPTTARLDITYRVTYYIYYYPIHYYIFLYIKSHIPASWSLLFINILLFVRTENIYTQTDRVIYIYIYAQCCDATAGQ